jgi:hypothetical protein
VSPASVQTTASWVQAGARWSERPRGPAVSTARNLN